MKKGLFLSLLCMCPLLADPSAETASLSSSSADYNGNTLVLKGHVVLDHGLAKMTAEQAFLEKQEAGKDFPFSFIRLQNAVRLLLPNKAELQCEAADLDFVTLKGVLQPKEGSKVAYTDPGDLNVRLVSDAIELAMSKKESEGKKTTYDVENLLAKGDVIIDYAKVFTLRAGHALYQKNANNNLTTITAYPKDASTPCQLSHEGDKIDADLVNFDLTNSKLSFQKPRGVLLSFLLPQIPKAEIAFRAQHLLWDHIKNVLFLKGDVNIKEQSLGTITSDGMIQLAQTKVKNKRLLKTIRSQGKTVLHYEDPSYHAVHELISYGSFLLDREHLRVSIESPVRDGVVPDDLQLSYKDAELLVHADKATMEYALVDHALQPVSLVLKGNVRLFSYDEKQPTTCGIADRISFSPATKTLILAADPQKRVLFWDEAQGMRVSSQEIHVTHDPASKQKAVKGIGNVKFAFTSEEHALLKQCFPSYKVE